MKILDENICSASLLVPCVIYWTRMRGVNILDNLVLIKITKIYYNSFTIVVCLRQNFSSTHLIMKQKGYQLEILHIQTQTVCNMLFHFFHQIMSDSSISLISVSRIFPQNTCFVVKAAKSCNYWKNLLSILSKSLNKGGLQLATAPQLNTFIRQFFSEQTNFHF